MFLPQRDTISPYLQTFIPCSYLCAKSLAVLPSQQSLVSALTESKAQAQTLYYNSVCCYTLLTYSSNNYLWSCPWLCPGWRNEISM